VKGTKGAKVYKIVGVTLVVLLGTLMVVASVQDHLLDKGASEEAKAYKSLVVKNLDSWRLKARYRFQKSAEEIYRLHPVACTVETVDTALIVDSYMTESPDTDRARLTDIVTALKESSVEFGCDKEP